MKIQLHTRKGWIHPRLANRLLSEGEDWKQACLDDYLNRFKTFLTLVYRDPIDENHLKLYQMDEEEIKITYAALYRQGA